MNNFERGRSMVEMLGVLAIVGILSVGAIAGYSKAMMKYKLNKQAEQINLVFNLITTYKSQWKFSTTTFLLPYYIKLGLIPPEMIKNNTVNLIYDVFNNTIKMTNSNAPSYDEIALSIYFSDIKSNRFDVCQNIMQIGKSNSEELLYFSVAYKTEENPSTSYSGRFYGDKYCNKVNCIKNITFNDIEEKCQVCRDTTECLFLFTWSMNN